MTTHALDRSTYRTAPMLAERIRQMTVDGDSIKVHDRTRCAYRVEPMPSVAESGMAYLLYTADGFSIGTFGGVEALVRYAAAMGRRRAA